MKITFTPMHGVGGEPVVRAFRAFNLDDLIPVTEQMEPDPEFPTVTFPNPEEGKSALVSHFGHNIYLKSRKFLGLGDSNC